MSRNVWNRRKQRKVSLRDFAECWGGCARCVRFSTPVRNMKTFPTFISAELSDALAKHAIAKGSGDNISVIVALI